jgi:hypothetical protein
MNMKCLIRNAYKTLVRKPKAKGPLGRSGHGWEGNINMDLKEIRYGEFDCVHLGQDRVKWRALLNRAMKFRVQQNTTSRWLLFYLS